jgi:phosphoglycolate phosphatase
MRRALFLFDIDGTLLHAEDLGRAALEAAMREVLGDASGLAGVSFGGRTDLAIVRLAAEAQGQAALPEAAVRAVLAAYEREVVTTPRTPCRAIPEAVTTVRGLVPAFGPRLGLGTGNVASVAALKVGDVGLSGIFGFGGYGDDAEDRAALLRLGLARGLAHAGLSEAETRAVVVGDTPRDVAAARGMGALAVAVATGSATARELAEAEPELLLESLSGDALGAFLAARGLV